MPPPFDGLPPSSSIGPPPDGQSASHHAFGLGRTVAAVQAPGMIVPSLGTSSFVTLGVPDQQESGGNPVADSSAAGAGGSQAFSHAHRQPDVYPVGGWMGPTHPFRPDQPAWTSLGGLIGASAAQSPISGAGIRPAPPRGVLHAPHPPRTATAQVANDGAGPFQHAPSSDSTWFAPTGLASGPHTRAQQSLQSPATAQTPRRYSPGPGSLASAADPSAGQRAHVPVIAPAPAAASSGPRPSGREETVIKQTRRTLEREIGPRVGAILASGEAQREAQIEAAVRRHLSSEDAARNAIRATIWQEPSPHPDNPGRVPSRADFPPADGDGYVYVRVHETRLDAWLAANQKMEAAFNLRMDALDARQVTLERRFTQLAPRAQMAPKSREPLGVLHSNSASASSAPQVEKGVFSATDAQSAARKLIARLYGLDPSFHAKRKPYHIPFPDNGDVPFHPLDYRPTRVDILVAKTRKEPVQPGTERRFRQLRYDWNTGPREGANSVWTEAILQSLCEDGDTLGIPRWATPDYLWGSGLATTWENLWKEAVRQRMANAGERAEERTGSAKMRGRLKRKLERRAKAAGWDLKAGVTVSDPDIGSVLVTALMSPEYSDSEGAQEDEAAGPSVGQNRKRNNDADVYTRPELAWRSGPVTHLFRNGLDKIVPPPFLLRNSGQVLEVPVGGILKGSISRCAIRDTWMEKNGHRAPQLIPNRGPYYPAPGALALSLNSYGPVEPDLKAAATRLEGDGRGLSMGYQTTKHTSTSEASSAHRTESTASNATPVVSHSRFSAATPSATVSSGVAGSTMPDHDGTHTPAGRTTLSGGSESVVTPFTSVRTDLQHTYLSSAGWSAGKPHHHQTEATGVHRFDDSQYSSQRSDSAGDSYFGQGLGGFVQDWSQDPNAGFM
ncbi:hypothetical protein OC844_000615 [Tilletia horrida]|nr:hypothetical protein OC844_000615 [Tilletia horrida]